MKHTVVTPDSNSEAVCLFKKTIEQLLICTLGSRQWCADFFLLGYNAVWMGNWTLTFWGNIVSSSRDGMSKYWLDTTMMQSMGSKCPLLKIFVQKVKLSMLYQPPHHERAQGSGGISLCILSPDTKWRSVELIYPGKRSPWHLLGRKLGRPHSHCGHHGEGKNLPVLGNKLWFTAHPGHCTITPLELHFISKMVITLECQYNHHRIHQYVRYKGKYPFFIQHFR